MYQGTSGWTARQLFRRYLSWQLEKELTHAVSAGAACFWLR
jgi:hypothetical protein